MGFEMQFIEIPLESLHREAAIMKAEGWRFMQTHAVNTDEGVDLYYSFMKDGLAKNLKVVGVTKDQAVPSITDLFLAAFVFENEARELFGVDMRDIAIDFAGAMYDPAVSEPMTFISKEQKAAREKALKAQKTAAEKAAKGASGGQEEPSGNGAAAKSGFVMTAERKARLESKMAGMSPEKVAKIEAALKKLESRNAAVPPAKSAAKGEEGQAQGKSKAKDEKSPSPVEEATSGKIASQVDHQLEKALELMDSDKAAIVRQALAKRRGCAPESDGVEKQDNAALKIDSDVESKLALMDPAKADKVRKALAAKALREASLKGGE